MITNLSNAKQMGQAKNQRPLVRRVLALGLACSFALALPLGNLRACGEQTIVKTNAINRAALRELQRAVNDGHDPWRLDAVSVAALELVSQAPELQGLDPDLLTASLKAESHTVAQGVYVWTRGDGKATYRITVRKYRWLLPLAGNWDAMVWVAERTEVTTQG